MAEQPTKDNLDPNLDKNNLPGNGSGDGSKDLDPADADLEKELADLEAGKSGQPAAQPGRSELERATFTAKSTLKRIKELGGDPADLLKDEIPPTAAPERHPVDTSNFVTKKDLAEADAKKLAKSPSELKLIMWWVENRGMSVEDAHFMANKNRIKKVIGEVDRSNSAIPASPGAGAGGRGADKPEVPDLPESEKRRLLASGMIYDPAKMAYVGKKVQHKYDPKTKGWVTERI